MHAKSKHARARAQTHTHTNTHVHHRAVLLGCDHQSETVEHSVSRNKHLVQPKVPPNGPLLASWHVLERLALLYTCVYM